MHPQAKQESIFFRFLRVGEIESVGVVKLAVLACVLRATTKKRSSTF